MLRGAILIVLTLVLCVGLIFNMTGAVLGGAAGLAVTSLVIYLRP
jgi:hypothetical protein